MEIDQRTITSVESVFVTVLKDKYSRKFEATKCTHIGCVPFPHFVKERKLVLEIEALNGNTICYRLPGNWTVGKCKKPTK
ncbi:MAG TPA: hypothetical protein VNJ01_14250 [Bacteriovoracaceae bacterium]|nr:hypothetical protein [Bacteriovoracaceae bacterium]